MNMISKFGAGAALALLAACGPMNEGSLTQQVYGQIGAAVGLGPTPEPEAAVPAPEVQAPAMSPQEALAASRGKVLIVSLISAGITEPMTKVGSSGGVDMWRTAGAASLSFRDGILVSSRSFGNDLMGADVDGLAQAIRAGQGTVARRNAFMDSEDQIVTRDMTCVVATQGPDPIVLATGPLTAIKVTETCTGTALSLTNTYWLDRLGGRIVQSRQALSPTLGFIQVIPL